MEGKGDVMSTACGTPGYVGKFSTSYLFRPVPHEFFINIIAIFSALVSVNWAEWLFSRSSRNLLFFLLKTSETFEVHCGKPQFIIDELVLAWLIKHGADLWL